MKTILKAIIVFAVLSVVVSEGAKTSDKIDKDVAAYSQSVTRSLAILEKMQRQQAVNAKQREREHHAKQVCIKNANNDSARLLACY